MNCSAPALCFRSEKEGINHMCQDCKKPYYITTAIAYASGKPHIGNTYEIVLADSIARYKREQGFDVRFQTGTDEHGQKIELKAEEAGVTPQEFVDGVAAQIKSIWDLMNTSYDKFIRTTDKEHEEQVQKIFKKLYDKGDIYKGHYEGLYCTPCESFWTSSQVTDGKCPDCGRPVVPAKEEAYFFKMSKYAQQLIDHINEHPEFIQPVSRKNEMMNNFLLPGLQDLCVFAHFEEVCLFLCRLNFTSTVRTFPINKLRLCEERFARRTVHSFIMSFVNISLIIELFENLLNLFLMVIICCTDKFVIRSIHQIPDFLDFSGNIVYKFFWCYSRLFCFELDLLTMLISSCLEKYIVSLTSLVSCDRVSQNNLISVSNMRFA